MKIFNVKRKRASLNLSLNAIVILVLAIAILGLGLTFIRGIFTGITAKVEEAVQAGEITNPPTRDRPVTITPPRVDIRVGARAEIKVALLNVLPEDTNDFHLEVWGTVQADQDICVGGPPCQCIVGTGTQCAVAMVFNENDLTMRKDQINLWTIAITPADVALDPDTLGPYDQYTYLYTAKLVCDAFGTPCATNPKEYSRDFIVVVKS